MKRLEKAYTLYPNGVVYGDDIGVRKVSITECCPYYINCGEDDLDEQTKVGEYGDIRGCRGISCDQCWDKEIL